MVKKTGIAVNNVFCLVFALFFVLFFFVLLVLVMVLVLLGVVLEQVEAVALPLLVPVLKKSPQYHQHHLRNKVGRKIIPHLFLEGIVSLIKGRDYSRYFFVMFVDVQKSNCLFLFISIFHSKPFRELEEA